MDTGAAMVLSGDVAEYPAFCEQAAHQFAERKSPEVSERITKTCLLTAEAIEIPKLPTEALIDSLDQGTASVEQQSWFWTTRALRT